MKTKFLYWIKPNIIFFALIVVLLVSGATDFIVASIRIQEEGRRIEQFTKNKISQSQIRAEKARNKEIKNEITAKKLLANAVSVPSEKNIALAELSIDKIKNEKFKKLLTAQLDHIKSFLN